jgi:ribosome biogenesis GTPase A
MAAGARALREIADLLDIVLEIRDARLPSATAVAHLHSRLKNKPTVVLLNREDLAQPDWTRKWLAFLHEEDRDALATIATRAASLRKVRTVIQSFRAWGRVRVGVVGAPNTGKSSVINALARRKKAVAGNRPGVTRQVRWIAMDERVDLLDTPGMLEPRISNATTAWQLALCGILPEGTFDVEEVASSFISWIRRWDPQPLFSGGLEGFARKRGMLRRGAEVDRSKAARAMLKAFQDGRLGRFTLEFPGDNS